MTFQNIFSLISFLHFRDVWCAARLIKANRIFVTARKRLIDSENSRGLSWLFDFHRSLARDIKKRGCQSGICRLLLQICLAPKKGALFSLNSFFKSFGKYYIPHIYVIPQAIPHAIPQTHSRPFTVTGKTTRIRENNRQQTLPLVYSGFSCRE